MVLILIVVVALFAAGVFDGDDKGTLPTTSPTSSAPTPSSNPGGQSPVVGTITDDTAGLSYAALGGEWKPQTIPSTTDVGRQGFTRGQIAVVQNNYDGRGGDYTASSYSGRLPSTVSYSGTGDLRTAAESLARTFESTPDLAYPQPHNRQDLDSRSHSVSGNSAWYVRFRLDFPQAASRGWNFRAETIVFIVVDRGSGERPSTFWVSMPDSHANGGDLTQLVDSLKTL